MLRKLPDSPLYIGLMSGTSLDGVDGVLATIPADDSGDVIQTLATAYLPFPDSLRQELLALQRACENELHREALAANALARHYAACVAQLLEKASVDASAVTAIGAHGQTIRHRPELGFTRQTNNPALLAELTNIDVVADFRSRDIAAEGQGAPLVPAFHQAVFGNAETRVVVNIGGIGNITVLNATQSVTGFDTGPGNVLMDGWIHRHRGLPYDADGAWAASGRVSAALLEALRAETYFSLPPPKSTGRDVFHMEWLDRRLACFPDLAPIDVQSTLAALTATTLADAISAHSANAQAVYVCGGGAHNGHLMHQLAVALRDRHHGATLQSSEVLGILPNHVEALAFAWLAQRHIERQPGNLPSVTGAHGLRILGGLYPK